MITSTLPRRAPRGIPILGHAPDLARGRFEFLRACALEYGDIVPLRFFGSRLLFLNHPDFVEQVLATNHRKVVKDIAQADYALVGDGLTLNEGEAWLHGRRMIQPSFHRARLAVYGDAVVRLADRMAGTWRDGETRELCGELTELAVAIVAQTLFDLDVRSGPAAALAHGLIDALACRNRCLRSFEMLLPARLPTPARLRLRAARRRIDGLLDRIIVERRLCGDEGDDLLSRLLRACDVAGQPLSDRQVRNEVLALVIGGTETVVDLLVWTWYRLALNPTVEARLVAEIATAQPVVSRPCLADIPRLPYTSRVVSEVLRLDPPAPALGRKAIADFDVGGYHVARGTHLLVSQWVMHRDPRYYPDPERFDPDRWADGLASRLPRYAYFPFGGGPRLCIGQSFATMEAILILATLARRFRLEPLPGHAVIAEEVPTLRPRHGLPVVIHARPGVDASR